MATTTEHEILLGRRAFPTAQALLGGGAVSGHPQAVVTGWHGTDLHPENGSFALVQQGAGLDTLVGQILRVRRGDRMVFVYCLSAAGVPTPLSLTRRCFAALGLLALESVMTLVDVVA